MFCFNEVTGGRRPHTKESCNCNRVAKETENSKACYWRSTHLFIDSSTILVLFLYLKGVYFLASLSHSDNTLAGKSVFILVLVWCAKLLVQVSQHWLNRNIWVELFYFLHLFHILCSQSFQASSFHTALACWPSWGACSSKVAPSASEQILKVKEKRRHRKPLERYWWRITVGQQKS